MQGSLIVNADDLGRVKAATNAALSCFAKERITSASAMVFMKDSERAAELASSSGLDLGLHVNFTERFTGDSVPPPLHEYNERIWRFLRTCKYALVLYNPFLRQQFRYVFQAQYAEFVRLYGFPPSHIDGHHHMHLATNMLFGGILPHGTTVRRSFSFRPGEKSSVNWFYRATVDRWLRRRHPLTDYFFALSQHLTVTRLERVVTLAKDANVELMAHPQVPQEYDFLMSDGYADVVSRVRLAKS